MAVKMLRCEKWLSLVASIRNNGSSDEIMADLYEAVAKIADSLDDKTLSSRAIDPSGTWQPGEDEFDVTSDENLEAWCKVIGRPELKDDLHSWLLEVEKLLVYNEENRFIYYFYENDDCIGFGQIPSTLLAILYRDFIPVYLRINKFFFDAYVIQHEYNIIGIYERHGRCAETEELLLTLPDGYDVCYLLKSHLEKFYDDFPGSEVFRRIVEGRYMRGDKSAYTDYPDKWPELTASAQAIQAELATR